MITMMQSLSRPWRQFLLLASLVVLLDQASKAWAVIELTDAAGQVPYATRPGLAGFLWVQHPHAFRVQTIASQWFHLRYVENPGAAWGFLSRSPSHWRTPMFLAISLASMVLVPWYFARTQPRQRALRIALGLVMGGAIGNFLDRSRLGYVIDFIDWHLGHSFSWPTFNLADAAITVGALLMLLDTLLVDRQSVAPTDLGRRA